MFLRHIYRPINRLGRMAHLLHSRGAGISRHGGVPRHHIHSLSHHYRDTDTEDVLHGNASCKGEEVRAEIRVDGSRARLEDRHNWQAGRYRFSLSLSISFQLNGNKERYHSLLLLSIINIKILLPYSFM